MTGHDWRPALRRLLDRLGRWTHGRLLVERPAGTTVTPAVRFFDPDVLGDTIVAFGSRPGAAPARQVADEGFDFTIATSRFARQYSAPLSAVALGGLAMGLAVDVAPENCAVAVRPDGRLAVAVDLAAGAVRWCAERPEGRITGGPELASVEELRKTVWTALYGRHLAPLFGRAHQLTTTSEALMWTSAAEYAALLSDAAQEYMPEAGARPFLADQRALFDAPELPGVPGPNPLRGAVTWVPVDGYPIAEVPTRRLCCLSYLLPERDGLLCANCPYLPPQDRAALVCERHGVPIGGADGPAAQRSREVGRQRPSMRLRRRGGGA